MQTVLGSNGQIGQEVAKELYRNYTKEIRLVGRHPKKIHATDQLVSADLLDFEQTKKRSKVVRLFISRSVYRWIVHFGRLIF